jgi:large subunit ribosomal protein L4
VSGTTKKSKNQKGGGARHGALKAPIFIGGGVTFAAKPRSFAQKVNRKMYRAGIAAILSQLAREDRIAVVESFNVEAPKTKLLSSKLKGRGLDSVLVITDELDENLFLSSRNLHNVLVLEAHETDPVSLIRFGKVLVTRSAMSKFEEMWA